MCYTKLEPRKSVQLMNNWSIDEKLVQNMSKYIFRYQLMNESKVVLLLLLLDYIMNTTH